MIEEARPLLVHRAARKQQTCTTVTIFLTILAIFGIVASRQIMASRGHQKKRGSAHEGAVGQEIVKAGDLCAFRNPGHKSAYEVEIVCVKNACNWYFGTLQTGGWKDVCNASSANATCCISDTRAPPDHFRPKGKIVEVVYAEGMTLLPEIVGVVKGLAVGQSYAVTFEALRTNAEIAVTGAYVEEENMLLNNGGCASPADVADCNFFVCAVQQAPFEFTATATMANLKVSLSGNAAACACDKKTWTCSKENAGPPQASFTAVGKFTFTKILIPLQKEDSEINDYQVVCKEINPSFKSVVAISAKCEPNVCNRQFGVTTSGWLDKCNAGSAAVTCCVSRTLTPPDRSSCKLANPGFTTVVEVPIDCEPHACNRHFFHSSWLDKCNSGKEATTCCVSNTDGKDSDQVKCGWKSIGENQGCANREQIMMNDINFQTPTADECGKVCKKKVGCYGYEWISSNHKHVKSRQQCHVFKDKCNQVEEAGVTQYSWICGVKNKQPTVNFTLVNVGMNKGCANFESIVISERNRSGGQLVNDPQECGQICAQEPGCSSFQFTRQSMTTGAGQCHVFRLPCKMKMEQGAMQYKLVLDNPLKVAPRFRSYRLQVTANAGADMWCIEELSFFDRSRSRLKTSPEKGTAESEFGEAYAARFAFNELTDKNANYYCSNKGLQSGWLQYDFGRPTSVLEYRIARILEKGEGYFPVNWAFQGSDDGKKWTQIDAQSEQRGWKSGETRSFVIENFKPQRDSPCSKKNPEFATAIEAAIPCVVGACNVYYNVKSGWLDRCNADETNEKTCCVSNSLNEPIDLGCVANFGSQEGSPVCCGQKATVQDATQICLEDKPICAKYVLGQRHGTCVQNKPKKLKACLTPQKPALPAHFDGLTPGVVKKHGAPAWTTSVVFRETIGQQGPILGLRFTCSQKLMVGLAAFPGNVDDDWRKLDFGLLCADGHLEVYEDQVVEFRHPKKVTRDAFHTIKVVQGFVEFWTGKHLLYTSKNRIGKNHHFQAALYSPGAVLSHLQYLCTQSIDNKRKVPEPTKVKECLKPIAFKGHAQLDLKPGEVAKAGPPRWSQAAFAREAVTGEGPLTGFRFRCSRSHVIAGLQFQPATPDDLFDKIDWGLCCRPSGRVEVWELGIQKFVDKDQAISLTDTNEIKIVKGKVEYWVAGRKIYTSQRKYSGKSHVQISPYSQNSKVKYLNYICNNRPADTTDVDCSAFGKFSVPAGMDATRPGVLKKQGRSGWLDSTVFLSEKITQGGPKAGFQFSCSRDLAMVGVKISPGNLQDQWSDMDYGVYCTPKDLRIVETGAERWRSSKTFEPSDVLSLQLIRGQVNYFSNGKLLYVSRKRFTAKSAHVQISLHDTGATISRMKYICVDQKCDYCQNVGTCVPKESDSSAECTVHHKDGMIHCLLGSKDSIQCPTAFPPGAVKKCWELDGKSFYSINPELAECMQPQIFSKYRLRVTKNGGGSQFCIGELSFFDKRQQRIATSPEGGFAETELSSSYAAGYAFDSTSAKTQHYCSARNFPVGWIGYGFSNPTPIFMYKVEAAKDQPASAPVQWVFEGSNDGVAWSTIDRQTGKNTWSKEKAFPINGGAPPMPIMKEEKQLNFIVAPAGMQNCPSGSRKVATHTECSTAAVKLKKDFKDYNVQTSPRGCFLGNDNIIYFNLVIVGKSDKATNTICIRK